MSDVVSDLAQGLHGLLDPYAIGVLTIDGSDTVRSANATMLRMLGRGADELLGTPAHHLMRPVDVASPSLSALTGLVRNQSAWSGVLEAVPAHGDPVQLDCVLSVLAGPAHPEAIVVVAVDAETSAFGSLGWFALHDPLTGLANRALLADRLGLAAAHASRDGGLVAAIFVDLNGFKAVNDALGHLEGDRVLRQMAGQIRTLLRPTDTLARYGGDELVAVCEAPTLDDLQEIVARLAAGAVVAVGPDWDLDVSVGAAVSAGGLAEPLDLVHRADQAMYRAKRSGHPELDIVLDEPAAEAAGGPSKM